MEVKFLKEYPKNYQGVQLSVSKRKLFYQCGAKFHYRYIQKLPRKEIEAAVFGNLLHESLDLFVKDIIAGSELESNKIMTSAYKAASKKFKVPEDGINGKKEAKKILYNYICDYETKKEKNELKDFLAAEEPFYLDIGGKVLLVGKIDLVLSDGNHIYLCDYKSTEKTKSIPYLKKDDFQLRTYGYIKCLQEPGLQEVKGSYILLRHGFKELTYTFTKEELMKMQDVFLSDAKKIQEEKLYRPTTSKLCEYCDYVDKCDEGKKFIAENDPDYFGETSW